MGKNKSDGVISIYLFCFCFLKTDFQTYHSSLFPHCLFFFLDDIKNLEDEPSNKEDEADHDKDDGEPNLGLLGGVFSEDSEVEVAGEDEGGETGAEAPAEAEHDIDGVDSHGDEGKEEDDGCRDDVDNVLVDGVDLGVQLKQTCEGSSGRVEQDGIRHNDVDGNGNTCNGRGNTLSGN